MTDLQTDGAFAQLLTDADLAERWQVTQQWLRAMRSAGRGPTFVRLGRAVRYRLPDVLEYERAGEDRGVT